MLLLEHCAAKREPEALNSMADILWNGWFGVTDEKRAADLWRQAAELGHPEAQLNYGSLCCAKDSVEQFEWLRRSATQIGGESSLYELATWTPVQVKRYNKCGSGRNVYEIGRALDRTPECAESANPKDAFERATMRAVRLYRKWRLDAERAVWCWLWLARDLGIVKDIRLLIADLIWEERAVWSERGQ